uniref:Uncharacterized protein n=1 Tax=Chlorocebus sabaeus TaxID=60711 RepID=A0A0D9REU2_CHLSB
MLDCSDYILDSRMNNPSETSKPSMESGDGNTGTQTNGLDFQKQPVPVGGAISTAQAQAFLGHLHQVQLAGTSLQAAAQSLNVQVNWDLGLWINLLFIFSYIFLIFYSEHIFLIENA